MIGTNISKGDVMGENVMARQAWCHAPDVGVGMQNECYKKCANHHCGYKRQLQTRPHGQDECDGWDTRRMTEDALCGANGSA